MKANVVRIDAHYEVEFARPDFGRIASFVNIIEPIYDALCQVGVNLDTGI